MDVHDEQLTPDAGVHDGRVAMPAGALSRSRTLLLVDDEHNILSALKRLLRRDEYHILTASSGQEGLEILAHHGVDVIVSDQRMPGMLGADFLRKAKLLYPQTIRIMLSGYTELQAVTDAVNEGAIFKFLTKPWEDHQLREHIAEAFRLKHIDDDNVRLHDQLRVANLALAQANESMQLLLCQQQYQINRDELSLGIARDLLQFLPLPVIGLDDAGMIAFINAAATRVFAQGAALLGSEAVLALPQLFGPGGLACIDGRQYAVSIQPMGAQSQSRGSLLTLSLPGTPS